MPYKDPEYRRAHHREYMRKHYHEDPIFRAKQLARVRRNNRKTRQFIRDIVAAARKGGCLFCGEQEDCCMSFHHLDSTQKDFTIATIHRRVMSPLRLVEELTKCICVCENCHRKIHAGLIKITIVSHQPTAK